MRAKVKLAPFLVFLACLIVSVPVAAQTRAPEHGERPGRLVITNAMVVDGVGTPAEGPKDIFIENGRIVDIVDAGSRRAALRFSDGVIDATGKYVLPGFINMHGHLHDSRAGIDMPLQYQYNLWLGSGITTVRDLGSDTAIALDQRERSAANEIVAPRLLIYMWFSGDTYPEWAEERNLSSEESIREVVRNLKRQGADGMKVHQADRDTFLIAADEAQKRGLKIAHHVGIESANAWDDAAVGTSTIEHWYGIPDAAIDGVQNFPADFNHNNELHRFRYAGRIWREADPETLEQVLETLVENGVAWDPTFAIYEACRDLQRALTQPAFEEYLHPALEAFFAPNPSYHGSFFYGWTNTDEVYWKENYQIWMNAVHEFERLGGVVTTGEDAGFIYRIYGFTYLRELQLHEEAGFHPLEVVRHATYNGARVLGREHELGRVKSGFLADLIVVNGNPLENLQILLPKGLNPTLDSQRGDAGGIEWTIKDGIPYHAPTLFADARGIVASARRVHSDVFTSP